MISHARLMAAVLGALSLTGCNWFDDDVADLAPTAEILFPTRTGYTPASSIKVRGTANDDTAVLSVTVNGILATSSDAYRTWVANVPLTVGNNTISVDVVDYADHRVTNVDQVVIERRTEIRRPFGYEIDAASNTLYYVDLELHKIMMTDLASGNISEFADLAQFEPVSSNGRPPLDIALDLPNNRVFLTVRDAATVGDSSIGVWVYDMLAETWSAFSDSTIDLASVFQNPSDLILDTANSRLLVVDFDFDALIAVNLVNGTQTVLSSNTIPSVARTMLDEPIDAALDSVGNRLLLVDRVADAVFSIDLATGTRTVVSGATIGTGPALNQPLSIAYDELNNRALVFDRAGSRGVIAVDLASGDRSVFAASFDDPNGLWLVDVRGLAISGNELIAFDNAFDHALGFDLTTGVRRIVTNNGFPRGESPPSLNSLQKIGNYFYGHAYTAIGRIDPNNSVEILAGDLAGGANSLDANDATVDASGTTAYTVGAVFQNNQFEYRIQQIDLATGTVTTLSDNMTPNADNPILGGQDLLFDDANNQLYLLERNRILRINAGDGERTVLAEDPSLGYVSPRSMALDSSNNRLLVVDSGYDHLIAVDLTSGAKTAFANTPVVGEVAAERPTMIELTSAGSLWIHDAENRLLNLNAQTGERAVVLDVDALDASYPKFWYDLTSSGGLIYIKAYSGILEYDPLTREFLTIFATPASSEGNNT